MALGRFTRAGTASVWRKGCSSVGGGVGLVSLGVVACGAAGLGLCVL